MVSGWLLRTASMQRGPRADRRRRERSAREKPWSPDGFSAPRPSGEDRGPIADGGSDRLALADGAQPLETSQGLRMASPRRGHRARSAGRSQTAGAIGWRLQTAPNRWRQAMVSGWLLPSGVRGPGSVVREPTALATPGGSPSGPRTKKKRGLGRPRPHDVP